MTNESEIISYLMFYGHNESLFSACPVTLNGVVFFKIRNELTGNAYALCNPMRFCPTLYFRGFFYHLKFTS